VQDCLRGVWHCFCCCGAWVKWSLIVERKAVVIAVFSSVIKSTLRSELWKPYCLLLQCYGVCAAVGLWPCFSRKATGCRNCLFSNSWCRKKCLKPGVTSLLLSATPFWWRYPGTLALRPSPTVSECSRKLYLL
jgi:hypothetical protein